VTALADVIAAEDPRRGRLYGWAGVVVAVVAALLTLPPFAVRNVLPSAALVAVALALGFTAVRLGAKRHGWGAVVAAVVCLILAILATRADVDSLEVVVVWSALLAATLRYATPLLFAGLGGLVSERAGVVNIGLEGMMLMGAFFAAWGADLTGSWLLGTLIGVLAGMALAAIHAFFCINLRADQIVVGFALNFIALGLTGYLYIDVYGDQGTPDDLPAIPNLHLSFLEDFGFIGEALANQNLLVWGGLLALVVVWIVVFRTRGGLRMRSVGENPRASETVGINVYRTRWLAVLASGGLAALGGAFLSIGFVHSFTQNMTAGRGYIALAAMIFGRWKPLGLFAATLLFGFGSALAQRLPEFSPSAATLFQALPYVLTLVAVAGLVGRSVPPAADGIPYRREG
jgi:general nucleoside transport system permease protein